MLKDKSIYELQEIIKSEYGKDLSFDEVRNIGLKLISLYKTVLNYKIDN